MKEIKNDEIQILEKIKPDYICLRKGEKQQY